MSLLQTPLTESTGIDVPLRLSTAFFATSPAPIITVGLDVFTQEVMAAITTLPWVISAVSPSSRMVRRLPMALSGRPKP